MDNNLFKVRVNIDNLEEKIELLANDVTEENVGNVVATATKFFNTFNSNYVSFNIKIMKK